MRRRVRVETRGGGAGELTARDLGWRTWMGHRAEELSACVFGGDGRSTISDMDMPIHAIAPSLAIQTGHAIAPIARARPLASLCILVFGYEVINRGMRYRRSQTDEYNATRSIVPVPSPTHPL